MKQITKEFLKDLNEVLRRHNATIAIELHQEPHQEVEVKGIKVITAREVNSDPWEVEQDELVLKDEYLDCNVVHSLLEEVAEEDDKNYWGL